MYLLYAPTCLNQIIQTYHIQKTKDQGSSSLGELRPLALSRPHEVSQPDERIRLLKAGGTITGGEGVRTAPIVPQVITHTYLNILPITGLLNKQSISLIFCKAAGSLG